MKDDFLLYQTYFCDFLPKLQNLRLFLKFSNISPCHFITELILTSSTIDKKLEIYIKLEIELENYKNLEYELEIDKKLEIRLEIFEIFVNFELYFEFFVNGR